MILILTGMRLAVKDRIEIDRWIISELNKTIKKVTRAYG